MHLFKRRKKLSFIEQEYAREGRRCPSEAPGGSVTAEPICSNDICKGFAEAGVDVEEASRRLNYSLGLLGTAMLDRDEPDEVRRLRELHEQELTMERNKRLIDLMAHCLTTNELKEL